MNDAAKMCVLRARAHAIEELQPRGEAEAALVAEAGDGLAVDVLHGEVRPAIRRRAGIEDPSDIWMRQQRERITLELEARHDVSGGKPELQDLEPHPAAHRGFLLREVHLTHGAFAEPADHPVRPHLVRRGDARELRHRGLQSS